MMHVLARESCFTCHFPHLLCQRWSILIMKHTHCQCRWEPAGQRSVNKASSHRLGNRNHVVNLFWNFFLGNKCSSKYWSCLSQIGKLKWYSCPRLVLLMARSTCHPECYHLLFQFGQWLCYDLHFQVQSDFPWHARPQSRAVHSRSRESLRIGSIISSQLYTLLLESKNGKGCHLTSATCEVGTYQWGFWWNEFA